MRDLHKVLSQQFGIVFQDEKLLETAFTHTSYANEHRLLNISHNERLEFLGDAVLQLLISEYLYKKYPDCQFDQFIKLGRGEEKSGGRNRDTILGDLFEAFLGALLLDRGVEAVKNFLYQVMIPKVEVGDFEQVVDYKTKLQELLQVNGDVEIVYQVISESGPAHAKEFAVAVSVDGRTVGQGQGRSKKLAEQEAAKNAFEKESHSCI